MVLSPPLYGDGRPVRLANDRFEQFQTGLKRHQFNMGYTAAVDRRTGLLQSFQASIVANGGGRTNCSVVLTMAGATSAQSVYYFPKTDVAATAIASRAVDCGSARGYGALETLTATELMMDEIAAELGLDPIEFRLRNVLKTGNEEHPGRDPGRRAARRDGAGKAARPCALEWPRRAQAGLSTPLIPENITELVSAASSGASATARKPVLPRWNSRRTDASRLTTAATEIGTGASSGQAVACARWLGRPADALELAVTDWADLPVETSGDPRHDEPSRPGPPGGKPALEPGLRVGVQCQQLVLLLHAYDARGGAHRLSSTGCGRPRWRSGRAARRAAVART